MKNRIRNMYWKATTWKLEGIGVIEVILILVIIIGLVLIFREKITEIVTEAFSSITGNATSINTEIVIPQQ